jgi:hypothetical protein
VDGPKTATHTFRTRPPPQVTLTLAPQDNGTISRSRTGAGIPRLCPEGCQVSYDVGTQVDLSTNPASGYEFGSWGGACAGQGAVCSLTMTSDRQVSVTFRQIAAPAISALTCDTRGRMTFGCTVSASPRDGLQIRWSVNGTPIGTADDQVSLSWQCGQNRQASITVRVSNARGSATKDSGVTCEGGS